MVERVSDEKEQDLSQFAGSYPEIGEVKEQIKKEREKNLLQTTERVILKLADTSVLIELLRGDKELEKELQRDEIAVCFHIKYELYRGTRLARKTEKGRREVEGLLNGLETVEMIQEVARMASGLRDKFSIGTFNLMVAAAAIVNDLKLITQDSDFQKIEELSVQVI